jgi:hypothetical protein
MQGLISPKRHIFQIKWFLLSKGMIVIQYFFIFESFSSLVYF